MIDRTVRLAFPVAIVVVLAAACQTPGTGPQTRTFTMSDPDVEMAWVLTAQQEEPCGGGEMAGGELSGVATFGALGSLDLAMSAAWDIGQANPDATQSEYEPDSPDAGGPFAPVLGQEDYPHPFQTNPFEDSCEAVVSASGELELLDDDGDELLGLVTGGETHRLDVASEGDGIETFVEVEFDGGSGKFSDASGSAVLHLITHFDAGQGQFVIDEIGVLAGGSVQY